MSQAVENTGAAVDPGQIAEDASRWAQPLIEALSDGFVALYLYGSAVDPGFDPEQSDVNLLLVAKALPATTIRALSTVWPKGGPGGAPANVVAMASDQIERASDTFALELAEVRYRGRLLAGTDVVAPIEVPEEALRHHIERELRVLSVRLRRVYLESHSLPVSLAGTMADGVGTVVACARGISYLRGSTVPLGAESALRSAAEFAEVEVRPWIEAWNLRHEPNPPSSVDSIYLDFLDAVTALMRRVDRHEAE